MNTSALILIILVWSIVTGLTGYFFYVVLKAPPKPEPDSFTDNDPEE
jgi:hypothetical protein